MKCNTPTTPTPDNTGSRATRIALSQHTTRIAGYGAETSDDDRRDGRVSLVPTVEFEYPDEGDEPTPCVRDEWVAAPLLEKCSKQRFACVPSGDVMTMPLLDKRLEVLRYALREAVERMDFTVIHRLVEKALATAERIATVQLTASTPGTRERHGEIVIEDSAERGRVLITFPSRPVQRTRRWLQICGFFSGGDGGVTYWRKRTFRRGENIALDNARHCVGKIVADAEKLAAAERTAERRNARKPIAA